MFNLDRVVEGYVECMEWADCGPDHETNEIEWSTTVAEKAVFDCAAFIAKIPDALAEALSAIEYTDQRLGHDFWLTRNGHGAGFWDRDELGPIGEEREQYDALTLQMVDAGHDTGAWGKALEKRKVISANSIGEKLTAIAKTFRGIDLYVGDDGKVHAS